MLKQTKCFKLKVNKVIEYYNNYGKYPSTIDKNPNIKSLGWFLSNNINLYKNNKLSDKYYLIFNKIPGINKKLNKQLNKKINIMYYLSFEEKVNWIIDFYKQYNILPSIKDKEFSSFSIFLYNQKQKYLKGKLSNEEYNLLIKIPTYKEKLESHRYIHHVSYKQKVNLIIEYYNNKGRLPLTNAKNISTKSLGNFLSYQKYLYNKNQLSEYKYNLLITIPSFKEKLDKLNDDKIILYSFKEKVKLIIKYYKDNDNTLPTKYNMDGHIRILGDFLSYQKQRYKKNKLTRKEYNLLITIPTYKQRLES